MYILKAPEWISEFDFPFSGYEDIPDTLFEEINQRLDAKFSSKAPLVSILVAAWNEEVNVLRAIASLSKLNLDVPAEIIVINNNSTDKTQKTLEKLHVKTFFQPIQGCGPSRQMGQEKASGKYVLLADADSRYPTDWATEMLKVLTKTGVVCVYGRYSFIPEKGFQRWKLSLLETMKDVIVEVRQFKRPYLNTYAISMGYIKEYGLAVGCTMQNVRGFDGRLGFDLMQFGKIAQVRTEKARVWTDPRTIKMDNSVANAIFNRVRKEQKRLFSLFTTHPPHDTKSSSND